MSYLSSFEYQGKSSSSLNVINALRRYVLGRNESVDQKTKDIWSSILHILHTKKIDSGIYASFALKGSSKVTESITYQISQTLASIFKEEGDQNLIMFNKGLTSILNEQIDGNMENKEFIVSILNKSIDNIDIDINEYIASHQKNSFLAY
jgi:hypothetical protein